MLALKTTKLEVNIVAALARACLEERIARACLEERIAQALISSTRGTNLPLKSIILVVALCNAVMATHDLLSLLMAPSCNHAASAHSTLSSNCT